MEEGDTKGDDVKGPQGACNPEQGVWFKLSGSVDPEAFCDAATKCVDIPE